MEDVNFAAALRAELVARIGKERYELWFGSQARVCVEAGRLVIHAANTFVCDWLRRNFAEDICASGAAVAGRKLPLEFDVDPNALNCGFPTSAGELPSDCGIKRDCVNPKSAGSFPAAAGNPKSNSRPAVDSPAARRSAAPSLAQFATGRSNEYAYRCAELTAQGLQQASPVLICGGTGFGKTHLLRALQAEFRRRRPRATAVYLTAEQFTTSFVEALRGTGLPSFRHKCRGAELLLVDDVQFFIGKARTIEEFQHTLDTLATGGRQLVLASDRNLAGLRPLGVEVTSRLAGGLVCEIGPPEFATRLAIARGFRDELGLSVDDDLLSVVASQITAGPRELRGAMYRLQAMTAATGQALTRACIENALAELARQQARTVRLTDVEQAVCDVFGVEAKQLRSESKGRLQSEPRMLAMWLARKYTRAPWSEIGQYFGRRSHSTVISAHRRVEKLIMSQAQIGVGDAPCSVEEAIRRLEQALRTA